MMKLSECEEKVMAAIWTNKVELSAKQIKREVNVYFKYERAPTTIGTYLSRLVKKEYCNGGQEKKLRYEQLVPIEQYRKEKWRSLVDVLHNRDAENKKDLK